jgi:hypothetical protein
MLGGDNSAAVAGVSTSYTYQDPQWGIQGLGAVDLGFAGPSVLEWHAVTPARVQVPPSRGRLPGDRDPGRRLG